MPNDSSASTEPQVLQWLQFATSLAAAAQHFAIEAFGRVEVMRKTDYSHVTSADFKIQRHLCERIARRFPDHAVLCEEAGDYLASMPQPGSTTHCWVIDPIDGTRNYARRLPFFCTSIALLEDGHPIVGVVANPMTCQTYYATRGAGAHLADRRLRVADTAYGHGTIVTFQPADDGTTYDMTSSWLRRVVMRDFGTTALHLAMLADGNVDGAIAIECSLWDIAAGALMVTEAGGLITDVSGRDLFPFDFAPNPRRHTPFIAGTPPTHAALIAGTRPLE